MQHYGLTLAPGVLFTYIKRTVLVMLGKLSIDDAFQANIPGLWQAIWASMIFTFLVSVYPGIQNGLTLLFANMMMQMVAVLVMVFLFMAALRALQLEARMFAYIVPFLWIENVQHLFAGIIQKFRDRVCKPEIADADHANHRVDNLLAVAAWQGAVAAWWMGCNRLSRTLIRH